MSNQERMLSQVNILISDLKSLTISSRGEDDSARDIDLENIQRSIFSFEISVAERSIAIKEITDAEDSIYRK